MTEYRGVGSHGDLIRNQNCNLGKKVGIVTFNINYKNTEFLHLLDFRDFLDFWVEYGFLGAWEVVKKVGGGVALRRDRVSLRGEP